MTPSKTDIFERLLSQYTQVKRIIIKGQTIFQSDEGVSLARVDTEARKMREAYNQAWSAGRRAAPEEYLARIERECREAADKLQTRTPDAPKVGTMQEATDYCKAQRARLRETGWEEETGCNGGKRWAPPWARRIMSLPLRHAWAVQKQLDAVVGATIPLDEDEAELVVEALLHLRQFAIGSFDWSERVNRLWARLREETPTPEPDALTANDDAETRQQARRDYGIGVGIDEDAEVRRHPDTADQGAFVAAWVWVSDND